MFARSLCSISEEVRLEIGGYIFCLLLRSCQWTYVLKQMLVIPCMKLDRIAVPFDGYDAEYAPMWLFT